jgi:peptidylprolyl isomerase
MGETVTDQAEGLPQVSGDLDQPVVTIPSGEPPEGLVVQPLIIGPGPEVTIMDLVTVHYTEYIWAGGTFVRQTYGYAPVSSYLMNAIPGWQRALQGQTTGSRVLLVVPPEQAYPQGNPKLGVPEGSTMVYVVDILYAAAS